VRELRRETSESLKVLEQDERHTNGNMNIAPNKAEMQLRSLLSKDRQNSRYSTRSAVRDEALAVEADSTGTLSRTINWSSRDC
jgi:hypothetical protein